MMAAWLLASCADSRQTYRIGVSQCSGGLWRDKVNNEMLAAQHLYEADAKVSIVCAHDNTRRQIRQIDSLVDAGIDLLVVAPNEDGAIAEALAGVMEKGIPVICFDRRVKGNRYTAFIGGDNVEAGRAIGVNVADVAHGMTAAGHKPLVVEVTALMSSTPAQERHKGFQQVMSRHPELTYVCRESDWSSDGTYRIVKELLERGIQADGKNGHANGKSKGQDRTNGQFDRTIVFCHNDGMATGAYKAVVESGQEEHVSIFGIDGMPGEGLEYVQLGHQTASYVYPTRGDEIVRLALNILTGNPYKRDNLMQGILVVRENAWSIAQTTNELMRQNRDLATIQDKLEDALGLYRTQSMALWASLALIAMLTAAVVLTWRAYLLTKRAIRKRQELNEEETLFYTNSDSRTLRRVFVDTKVEDTEVRSQDSIFAETLNEAIRQRMSDPNLKMDDLGESVGLSRVQLYRRVKAITGLTPVELLRQMRLQQAYVLLGSTTKTVSEIAFEVGFNTPGYFSKCFKEQYGKLPMELRESTDSTNPT